VNAKAASAGARAALVGAVVAAAILGVVASGAFGHDRAAQLSFRLDHFLCYSIGPYSAFKPRKAVVRDQFLRRRTTRVLKPESFCNPAMKDDIKIRNRRAHLLCYATTPPATFRTPQVTATNQFGTVKVQVLRPSKSNPITLCLPSGKSIPPSVSASIPKGLDHFQCYAVKPLEEVKPQTPTVRDQFDQATYDVTQPDRLCNPAVKDKVVVVNKRDHLLCYAVEPRKTKSHAIFVRNQYGRLRTKTLTALRLCLPSLKTRVTS
jgi:hypothetical protein